MGERLRELHALAHTVGEAADHRSRRVGEAHLAERPVRRGLRVRDAPQPRAQRDHRAGGEERPRASRSWAILMRV